MCMRLQERQKEIEFKRNDMQEKQMEIAEEKKNIDIERNNLQEMKMEFEEEKEKLHFEQHNLQEMNGASRWLWTHGIRNGTEYPEIGLADWFGTPREPIERNDERFSIIFSFAPHPELEAIQFSRWRQEMK